MLTVKSYINTLKLFSEKYSFFYWEPVLKLRLSLSALRPSLSRPKRSMIIDTGRTASADIFPAAAEKIHIDKAENSSAFFAAAQRSDPAGTFPDAGTKTHARESGSLCGALFAVNDIVRIRIPAQCGPARPVLCTAPRAGTALSGDMHGTDSPSGGSTS